MVAAGTVQLRQQRRLRQIALARPELSNQSGAVARIEALRQVVGGAAGCEIVADRQRTAMECHARRPAKRIRTAA